MHTHIHMRFGRRFCRRSRVLLYTLPHADRAYTLTPTLQSCWLILQSHAYWVILGHTGTNTANVQGGAALFKGTVPALVRQTTYTSIVMVCFPKVKTAIARDVRPRMPLYFISFVSFFFVEMPSPPPLPHVYTALSLVFACKCVRQRVPGCSKSPALFP